jgi:hypothetical protein
MRPGELLCTVTDGVTEAQNRARALYGSARAEAILPALAAGRTTTRDVVDALRADVEAFAAGAEPADDLTILALRWRGPAAGLTRDGKERSVAPGRQAPPRGFAVQRTTISTRRLRGSAAPSGVGTNNSRFPRPTATMFSGAIPFWMSPAG